MATVASKAFFQKRRASAFVLHSHEISDALLNEWVKSDMLSAESVEYLQSLKTTLGTCKPSELLPIRDRTANVVMSNNDELKKFLVLTAFICSSEKLLVVTETPEQASQLCEAFCGDSRSNIKPVLTDMGIPMSRSSVFTPSGMHFTVDKCPLHLFHGIIDRCDAVFIEYERVDFKMQRFDGFDVVIYVGDGIPQKLKSGISSASGFATRFLNI